MLVEKDLRVIGLMFAKLSLMLRSQKVTTWLLWCLIIIYITFFTVVSFLRHERFETAAYDLGIFDQVVWFTSQGKILKLTNLPDNYSLLNVHFAPILIPLSLSYLVAPTPKTLLLLQSVSLGLSALPIFWLAKQKLNVWAGLAFTLIYLLFPALEGANLFDFHPATLAVVFLAFAYWYLQCRNYKMFLLFALLIMSCKEELSLYVVMMGLYAAVINRDWKIGIGIFILGMVVFLTVNLVVMPIFSHTSQVNFHLFRYSALGDTAGDMLQTLLSRPKYVWEYIASDKNRLYYLRNLLAPTAYLSLLDPATLLTIIPTVAINVLSNWTPTYALDRFHYTAPAVPFIVAAAINGMAWLVKLIQRLYKLRRTFIIALFIGATLVVAVWYHVRFGHTPIGGNYYLPAQEPRHAVAHQLLDLIPPDAIVSAQANLNPHLTHRVVTYSFPKIEDSREGPATYIALDTIGNIFPLWPDDYNTLVGELYNGGDYEAIFEQDGYLLLRRISGVDDL